MPLDSRMWKRVKGGVQGRVARFRVPGGAEPAETERDRQPGEGGNDDRPMPVAASILWQPIDGPAEQGAGPLPIFITQRALAAIHDHCAAGRETCFGFLTGNVLGSQDAGDRYVVVESTIRLPGGHGDDVKSALLQGWVVAQDVVHRTGDQLVGWYCGRWSAETGLGPTEAEAHAALFGLPWQLAVVVGSGDATVGGVFRSSATSSWAQECLPFFELVDPASFRPDGSKPTRLRWDNYRTEETALVPPAALPVPAVSAPPVLVSAQASVAAVRRAASPLPPRVLLPDQFSGGDEATGGGAYRGLVGRIARWGAYAAVGTLAVVGLFRLYAAVVSPTAEGSSSSVPAAAASSLERLDRVADTLGLAIAAFDLRARLFASRQMQCPELARGLVLVEGRWTTYNVVRKETTVPLDSVRTARDRALYTDVDGVERRFERSACTRP
jgi:hypothetical protein